MVMTEYRTEFKFIDDDMWLVKPTQQGSWVFGYVEREDTLFMHSELPGHVSLESCADRLFSSRYINVKS